MRKISAKILQGRKLFSKFFPCRCHFLLITSKQLRDPALTARATPGCFIYDVIAASSLLSSSSFLLPHRQTMVWAKRVGI